MIAPSWLKTQDGQVLSSKQEAPKTIQKVLEKDYEKEMAAKSSLAARVGARPWIEPLRDHNRSTKTSRAAAESLKAMAEGAWMTQAKLYDQNKVETAMCQLCKRAAGTLRHRLATCPMTEGIRQQAKGAQREAIEEAQSLRSAGNPLYDEGVAAWPTEAPRRRAEPEKNPLAHEKWKVSDKARAEGREGFFETVAVTDGSLIDAKPREARRAGFAAATPDKEGYFEQLVYGPFLGLDPTAFKAELDGAVRVAELCMPPVKIYLGLPSGS